MTGKFYLLLLCLVGVIPNTHGQTACQIDQNGRISSLTTGNGERVVAFRNDQFAGPSLWLNDSQLPSAPNADGNGCYGQTDSIAYRINYIVENDRLRLDVACRNRTKSKLSDIQLSLRLGIDTEMSHYPEWRDKFFPTLMRCEKDHFWGYFMTPDGRVLSVSSPDAIASYHLHYNNSAHRISFGNGHRIRTVSLDLLNPAPLPERHPQQLSIAPGAEKVWRIYLEEAADLDAVIKVASANTQAPMFQSDFYTLPPGQRTQVRVVSPNTTPRITAKYPDGSVKRIAVKNNGNDSYTFDFTMPVPGIYTFCATGNGRTSQMKLSCRAQHYSDYAKAARKAAIRYQQKTNTNAESWYGLFSAMIAREHFPDAALDNQLDFIFHQINSMTFDLNTHMPLNNPMRIQDTALKAALWAQYYKATGDIEHLRWAADLADFLLVRQVPERWDILLSEQRADGAYRAGKTHYTSVIYIAKGIMEVMKEEARLMDTSDEWAHRYKRHYASVKMAMDDLARNLDNIQTEGEMTFEDGMISCSYTQLSEFALLQPEGSEQRAYYTEAAEKLASMHRCLSQIIIPDSRMNGGSLRFWEAQYDILTMPNMMNSPHGWSAWRIYGLRNLYLLTGKYDYLRQTINAIGSCIQLLDPATGVLNWAFVGDPYVQTRYFVADDQNPGKGKHIDKVIGETYLPMISDWYRADTTRFVSSFGRFDGGSCDNDVHEIFKCLSEVILTSAYVYEAENGNFECHNCTLESHNGTLVVTPAEACVDAVHVNLRTPRVITARFADRPASGNLKSGWLSSQQNKY